MDVSRSLIDAISKENISVKPPSRLGRPSAEQLKGFLQQFKGHPSSIEAHIGLLQLACGVVETLEHEYHSSWEKLSSDEQVNNLDISHLPSNFSCTNYVPFLFGLFFVFQRFC